METQRLKGSQQAKSRTRANEGYSGQGEPCECKDTEVCRR